MLYCCLVATFNTFCPWSHSSNIQSRTSSASRRCCCVGLCPLPAPYNMHAPSPPKQGPSSSSTDGSRRAPPRSMLRYSSSTGEPCRNSSSQPIPTATASPAALPTVNNRVLQLHALQFQLLQQQMLEEHMRVHMRADTGAEGDAPLPVPQYAHMSDLLLPERDPEAFQAWRQEMQQKVQQRLQLHKHRQTKPQAS